MFRSKTPPIAAPKINYEEQRNKAKIHISFNMLMSVGYTPISIERQYNRSDESLDRTVLSCIDDNAKAIDFYYECSLDQHNGIVQNFIKFSEETKDN